jgi:hypothetical protein
VSAVEDAAIDFAAIREGLRALPRTDNVLPGQVISPAEIVVVGEHRAALDVDRALVVGNRGMGKSFWAHALASPDARARVATDLRMPDLRTTDVRIGFNASERDAAPSPAVLGEALARYGDADIVWRAGLIRAVLPGARSIPPSFFELIQWVRDDVERAERLLGEADDAIAASGRRLLVVFDALDRLGSDWRTTRALTRALLRRALAVRSYRAIRLKLFMRTDQFSDASLFDFPDGSKIKNTRVDLRWSSGDLYTLLFERLSRSSEASAPFEALRARVVAWRLLGREVGPEGAKAIVDAIAGEFMGADRKRGRVFTWLPQHLADAYGDTSPRTFLTAWREAARSEGAPPAGRAVDHLGLLEGVRKASADRMQELREDYFWIDAALAPLRGQMVPMDRATLEALWRADDTAARILQQSRVEVGLPPVQLDEAADPAAALLAALRSIGVMESRTTGKIDVPDIFRVEAEIKRKGGVKPPRRAPPADR